MLVCRKSLCHTIKNWCNFNRFNTIPNGEILLNLIRKMKYLTDQFQLRFCFCIGNAKWLYFVSALATQLASLRQVRRQQGGQRMPPHFTFGPPVAAYIQYCIFKMCPPPAAKSWRRACLTDNLLIATHVLSSRAFRYLMQL